MKEVSRLPLIKKIGINNEFRIIFYSAPSTIYNVLDSLPENITINPED